MPIKMTTYLNENVVIYTVDIPPVARENNDLDWITNFEMYSRDLKHFWSGSWRSVDVTKSAQWRTQLNNPLKWL